MKLEDFLLTLKGGRGSGNFGHGGRKGKRGGSTSKSVALSDEQALRKITEQSIRDVYKPRRAPKHSAKIKKVAALKPGEEYEGEFGKIKKVGSEYVVSHVLPISQEIRRNKFSSPEDAFWDSAEYYRD